MPGAIHPATLAAGHLLRVTRDSFAAADARLLQTPYHHKSDYLYRPALVGTTQVSAGRKRLDAFEDALTYLYSRGVKLGYLQVKLINAGRTILLGRIFGEELVTEMGYLRERFNVQRIYRAVAVTMPRRIGKTTVETLLSAAVGVSQPDGNNCCFNLKSRQATAWLSQAVKWLEMFQEHPVFRYTEVNRNRREYIIILNYTGTKVQISSFPGPVDAEGSNFRGMGERLMILFVDEFYFFKPTVYPTILPLAMNGAVIMMTSSMSKAGDDTIRRMLYAKLDAESDAFLRLDWSQACPTCIAKGDPDGCTHIVPQPQHFQRNETQKFLKAIITPFGADSYEREMMNMARKSGLSPVFAAGMIDTLADRANDYTATKREQRALFVGVDPAGDGFSECVIVSAFFDASEKPPGAPHTCVVHLLLLRLFLLKRRNKRGGSGCIVAPADAAQRRVPRERRQRRICHPPRAQARDKVLRLLRHGVGEVLPVAVVGGGGRERVHVVEVVAGDLLDAAVAEKACDAAARWGARAHGAVQRRALGKNKPPHAAVEHEQDQKPGTRRRRQRRLPPGDVRRRLVLLLAGRHGRGSGHVRGERFEEHGRRHVDRRLGAQHERHRVARREARIAHFSAARRVNRRTRRNGSVHQNYDGVELLKVPGKEDAQACTGLAAQDLGACILAHIRACRQRVPGLVAVPVFVIIESNSIMVAESTKREVVRHNENRVYVVEEDRRKARGGASGEAEVRAGTRTTNATKEWQMNALHELLALNALKLHTSFVVSQPLLQPANPSGGSSAPRDHLITELRNMRVERIAPKTPTPYAKTKLRFSGRHPSGERARDDYVMALGFILLMQPTIMTMPRYRGLIPAIAQ